MKPSTAPITPEVIVVSVARRATDLAHDHQVRASDAGEHLQRLAMGRRAVLEGALDELSRSSAVSPATECARRLLRQAIGELPADRLEEPVPLS